MRSDPKTGILNSLRCVSWFEDVQSRQGLFLLRHVWQDDLRAQCAIQLVARSDGLCEALSWIHVERGPSGQDDILLLPLELAELAIPVFEIGSRSDTIAGSVSRQSALLALRQRRPRFHTFAQQAPVALSAKGSAEQALTA
jgi:hypothetical protein